MQSCILSQGISGNLAGRITKLLTYGEHRKSALELEVGDVKNAFREIASGEKDNLGANAQPYQRRRSGINELVRKLR